ncbi:MAG: hypothetical protein N4A36_02000 [Candidatus Gracilibacteria bacterium]|jgi:hypothetical protein|nr:hypothetical protein [Candidatus Gracilibacteria bacterium]
MREEFAKLKMSKKEITLEATGWAGAFLFLLAYLLISVKILDAESPIYHIINLIGSFFYAIGMFYKRAFAGVFLEVVWSIIAIASLSKIFFH